MRFDFSHGKALTPTELGEVEGRVAAVVAAALPVSAAAVPLAEARRIACLRAVFGETYPDPVRVVSVEHAVAEVTSGSSRRGAPRPLLSLSLESPCSQVMRSPEDAKRWGSNSVEFCGGTHMRNTAEAKAFVITEETATAKG